MRVIAPFVINDLKKKMVWIAGPRQCGKTHLSKQLLKHSFQSGQYLSWDRAVDRKIILNEEWSPSSELLIFDEIHKTKKWKSLVKGYYDTFHEQHKFLITGSAQLDTFKRGGDSLLGRYHYWRLHPFTLFEKIEKFSHKEILKRLLHFGGFPEPFLDGDQVEAERWRQERYNRIINEDIRDLENVKDIDSMRTLLELLRSRVGSTITVSNLAVDLQKSPTTITHWIDIFEKMYLIFKVYPYSKNIPRSLLKPFKVYFFDNTDVIGDEGARFENCVATHLLKKAHFSKDRFGKNCELKYIRDKEHREVDFALIENNKVKHLIEAKVSEEKPSPHLIHFSNIIKPESSHQVILNLKRSYTIGSLRVENILESNLLLEL